MLQVVGSTSYIHPGHTGLFRGLPFFRKPRGSLDVAGAAAAYLHPDTILEARHLRLHYLSHRGSTSPGSAFNTTPELGGIFFLPGYHCRCYRRHYHHSPERPLRNTEPA